MTELSKYFSILTGGKIDHAAGIIHGVSVITEGEAKGHGILIDSKTLETVLNVAREFASGVKVKLRHRQENEHQNVISETAGTLRNFSIQGNKVRADFHVLKSLPADVREKIFEMAEVVPDQFGFSIAFSGVCEERNGKKFARCEELQSIDLSDNPAANPDGLFDSKASVKSIFIGVPTNEELATALAGLTKTVADIVSRIGNPQPVTALSRRADSKPRIDPALKGSDRIIAAWEADYGDLEQMRQRFQLGS